MKRISAIRKLFSLAVMLAVPVFAQPGAAVPMSGGEVTPPMLRQLPPSTPSHFEGPDVSPAMPVAPVAPRAGRVPKNCTCTQRGTASAPRPDALVSPPPATPAACAC